MTSKADKLPLETEPVARDNNTILTLKRGSQTLSRLTQLIIVVSLERKETFQNSKQHFFSYRLLVYVLNGFGRNDAIFVIVPL